MPVGIIGRKVGMTQLFAPDGSQTAVTVIEAGPCVVLDLREKAKHGYCAVRVGAGEKPERLLTKPEAGFFRKIGLKPCRVIREFRVREEELGQYKPGDVLGADRFAVDEYVDVQGVSKGKGFQGVQKRHGMAGGPGAHGSHFGREPGSTGNRELPGRVFKNKRMPGRMGRETVTVQNLKVVRVDPERNLLFVKGAVPGVNGSWVTVRKAVKKYGGRRV